MNVSGHRLSTTEIESALVSHPWVAEAAVVGASDETTGQAVVAFVILRGDAVNDGDATVFELRNHVGKEIGPIAKPKHILVVPELPKTRSARSCAASSRTSQKAAKWAMPPPCPTQPSWPRSRNR